jgi:hypothetical protein
MNFYELANQMENNNHIAYTGIVLEPASRATLLQRLGIGNGMEMGGWEIIAHHMTINLNAAENGPAADLVGQEVELTATSFAENDRVMAVGVETDMPSINEYKHITIAVHRANGGKPAHSNRLENWRPIPRIPLRGIVKEVPR